MYWELKMMFFQTKHNKSKMCKFLFIHFFIIFSLIITRVEASESPVWFESEFHNERMIQVKFVNNSPIEVISGKLSLTKNNQQYSQLISLLQDDHFEKWQPVFKTDVSVIKMVVFIPCSVLITVIASFGLGSFLAALNVKYRDFRYLIPFLIQSLMFLTPVIYPVSIIKNDWAKYLMALNPMSGAIDLARNAIINKPLNHELLAISVISAILLFFIGLFYFRKTEAYFADIA